MDREDLRRPRIKCPYCGYPLDAYIKAPRNAAKHNAIWIIICDPCNELIKVDALRYLGVMAMIVEDNAPDGLEIIAYKCDQLMPCELMPRKRLASSLRRRLMSELQQCIQLILYSH